MIIISYNISGELNKHFVSEKKKEREKKKMHPTFDTAFKQNIECQCERLYCDEVLFGCGRTKNSWDWIWNSVFVVDTTIFKRQVGSDKNKLLFPARNRVVKEASGYLRNETERIFCDLFQRWGAVVFFCFLFIHVYVIASNANMVVYWILFCDMHPRLFRRSCKANLKTK